MRNIVILVLATLAGPCLPAAELATLTLPEQGMLKAENGLYFSWTAMTSDRADDQIRIFNSNGKLLTALKILPLSDDAIRASVLDVSATLGGVIAVSAVYRSRAGAVSDTLLYFNWNGRISQAIALAPSREAWRLVVDSQSNVWTVTTHDGGQDPARVPLIVEYDQAGNTTHQFLNRAMFPQHAAVLQESSRSGPVGFGLTGRTLWAWLSGSADLITIDTDNGSVHTTKTGLPAGDTPGSYALPLRMVMLSPSLLLAEFRNGEPNATPRREIAEWLAKEGGWREVHCDTCGSTHLMGAVGKDVIYIESAPGTARKVYRKMLSNDGLS